MAAAAREGPASALGALLSTFRCIGGFEDAQLLCGVGGMTAEVSVAFGSKCGTCLNGIWGDSSLPAESSLLGDAAISDTSCRDHMQ